MSVPPAPTGGLAAASLSESVRFVVSSLLPSLLRGLFSPRPRMMRWLTAANADGRAIAVVSEMRREHRGQGARLFGGRLVVLWGDDAIREVLDGSAEAYASDAGAKGKGMSHFQPDAATLSRGEDWRDRRAFNESVLATSESAHPLAERFLAVVEEEVGLLDAQAELAWPAWERLFDRITLRVIFGDRSRDDSQLTGRLEKLMGEANRIVALGASDDYYELYGELERRLRDPEPGSLLSRFDGAPQSDRTRAVHQIPHWMFAMRDTLGANAYRALAAVVADPAVERRARGEIEEADLSSPSEVVGMSYLEGCLQEAMRLWPTTPLLVREAVAETTLAGQRLAEGAQVMIPNPFNHRDAEQVEGADELRPERWSEPPRSYRFNHLSNGSQDCPGGPMVLLLGKAVLARTLERCALTLRSPTLAPGEPLPHMVDFFAIRFGAAPAPASPRARAGGAAG